MNPYRAIFTLSFVALLSSCISTPDLTTSTPQELNNHANRLDDSGNSLEALRYYEAALKKYPVEQTEDRASCYYNCGLALRRLNRLEEAIAAYEQSLKLNENLEKTYVNYGLALEKAGRSDEAKAIFSRGLARFPNSLYIIENMAILLIKRENTQEAVPYVNRAVQIRESNPQLPDNHRYLPLWRNFLRTNG